ncbi:LysR family transcriptional regulator substrate-binding protein [Lentzea flava]|uniref:LysR family transcriptional regulator n=1 Tax=Lentzea flava TaxID=103732 RepID=A0ABQ2UG17_9PSEU|nr:LysR family transcriptional regulator substrate-binding protein [Lentzea flava]MCP2198293.1 LysR substrate binding domain-containing protein [Lentzea flava]GGU31685.1 LysR family transcriptional regulator [Lentzea flava]
MTGSFTLAYVPGVTPGKWARVWQERLPETPLTLVQVTVAEAAEKVRSGEADAALLRLPGDREDLHAIPLYTETTVVVFPKDHEFAAADELSLEDLKEHVLWQPLDDVLQWDEVPGQPPVERPETTADAIEIVAAGAGLLVVPQSLARLHHRKDLTYAPLTDAPQSRVALSFPIRDENPELVEHMIGIVRGRTVNSTRGPQQEPVRKQQRRGPAPRQQKPAKRAKPRRGR